MAFNTGLTEMRYLLQENYATDQCETFRVEVLLLPRRRQDATEREEKCNKNLCDVAPPMFAIQTIEFYRRGTKAQRNAKEMPSKGGYVFEGTQNKTHASFASSRLCGEKITYKYIMMP
jgi:hypothetical protein